VVLETMISVLERAKTFHALDRAATVIGHFIIIIIVVVVIVVECSIPVFITNAI
jgi:hypothetical protein